MFRMIKRYFEISISDRYANEHERHPVSTAP
jgi:hypothetical protein